MQTDFAADLPPVQADAAALRRALQNLLNNARKYSGTARWIGLQAALDDPGQSAAVRLTVRDHGLGIAATNLPHICEPFYRGTEAKAAQVHGNGLGLSLEQNIVNAHGGKLEVESEAGQGSAFTIRLQLSNSTAQPATPSIEFISAKAESQ